MANAKYCFLVSSILLVLTFQCGHILASTPAPTAPSGQPNLTDILTKGGGFSAFIRLLEGTQVSTQIQNQLNSSYQSQSHSQGLTILAPSDNAFNTLKAGTLNSLTSQQQVQLALYHVIPKFYNWDTFSTASNPVQTEASGSTGNWGVNITNIGIQQVNVSTGVVQTQINNALTQTFPLAVYQIEKVLLPRELFGSNSTATSPPAGDSSLAPDAAGPSASNHKSGSTSTRAVASTAFLLGVALVSIATSSF